MVRSKPLPGLKPGDNTKKSEVGSRQYRFTDRKHSHIASGFEANLKLHSCLLSSPLFAFLVLLPFQILPKEARHVSGTWQHALWSFLLSCLYLRVCARSPGRKRKAGRNPTNGFCPGSLNTCTKTPAIQVLNCGNPKMNQHSKVVASWISNLWIGWVASM